MKLFVKKDLFIILSLLVAALILFIIFSPCERGTVYQVTVGSEVVCTESLFVKKRTVLECGAVIVCDGKSVAFDSSDCPDKTCVKTGKLSQSGEWAACLPNKTYLKVHGGNE